MPVLVVHRNLSWIAPYIGRTADAAPGAALLLRAILRKCACSPIAARIASRARATASQRELADSFAASCCQDSAMMSRIDKRKEPDPEDQDLVEVMPLGAGQEVGRSCVIVKYM